MKKRVIAICMAAIMLMGLLPSVVAQAATIHHLTGYNKRACEALITRVADVAAGRSTSTVFEISLEEMGLAGRFTAADLGVASIVAPGGALAQDAKEAILAMMDMDLDLSGIISELLLACPYEMYWYDKTEGVTCEWGITGYSGGYDPEIKDYYLKINGSYALCFSFSVAQEYAAGEYTVRQAAAVEAWNYTASADEIIARYAGSSDYEKLAGYRSEVCALATYDENAAKGGVPYGNPWQPVWVFDGIDETAVVCEGYAKAFQYLCDHTEFSSDAIRCYTVWGTMAGGTGAGDHMWNILAMNDGANYLVDLTNCDEGAIGADDLLFLKGYDFGSAETLYSYRCGSDTITYVYDADMWDIYEKQELVLSAEDYRVPGPAEFLAVNMTLDEGIGLNFLLDMHDTPVDSSYMEFRWGDDKYSTDDAPVLVTDGAYAGLYRYTCRIAAKEIYDVVYATVRDDAGQSVAEFSYSGASYLAKVKAIGTEKEAELANAAAVYCVSADAYFSGNAPLSVPEPTEPIAAYFSADSQTSDGEVSYYGQSLLLRDVMKMRLYFRAPDVPVVTVGEDAVTVVAHMTNGKYDGYYTVDVPISPAQIRDGFDIRVQDTAIAFTIGVGDYLAKTLEPAGGNVALKELCKAIYWYGEAAQAYLAE